MSDRVFTPSATPSSETVGRYAELMAAAWGRGERPRATEYLEGEGLSEEHAIRLIYEEACLRREHGETEVSDLILARYPRYRQQLSLLLECDRMFRALPPADFPGVGDDLGDFRLEAEIGRGSVGRTYLARQHSLADRLVVLKATPLVHEEHLSLARLRHTNIVPIYFEHAIPERRIRLIGMPYLGGSTLARVLDDPEFKNVPAARRTGRQFLEALDRRAAGLPTDDLSTGPFRAFMAKADYVQVVCWIGACLAEALQYAHDRELIHLDVKPSNVQLAADGQPMLLDFHLARAPVGPGFPVPDRLGGTVGFLSPEQREVMDSLREGRPIRATIDGRSDIYSLGLLLEQALGGASDPAAGGRPLRSGNPAVSTGLSDIIQKCLAPAPEDRYADAGSLARDLRRHLSDQPLVGVANRSWLERWRKWRKRSPSGLTVGLLRFAAAPALLAALVIGFALVRQWDREIDDSLAMAKRHLHRDHYDEAALALRRGLQLASFLPELDNRKQALRDRLARVENERTAASLHEMVDMLRSRLGVGDAPENAAASLLARGKEIWALQNRFSRPGGERMKPNLEAQIRTDFLDLATIWADLAARSDKAKGSRDGLRDAVSMLREARARFGLSPALARDLGRYLALLGERDPSLTAAEPPRTAWEYYDLGRSYLQSGEDAAAEQAFRRSVELEPDEFWPQFFWGVCAYRTGLYHDATIGLSAAIALNPRAAECYYNRAKAHEKLGEDERAIADYTRALEIKPLLADAALNRGILDYRQGRLQSALADLETALALARTADSRGLCAYNLALIHLKSGDQTAARACLKQAIAEGNPDARDRALRLDPPLEAGAQAARASD